VEIFRFDRGERLVRSFGSQGFRATRIAAGTGQVSLTCLTVEPGGVIGTHPATGAQLFLVIAGEGWAAGPDGERVPIAAGWGVRWDAGEIHTSGTDTGLTALSIEGDPLDLFEPETPHESGRPGSRDLPERPDPPYGARVPQAPSCGPRVPLARHLVLGGMHPRPHLPRRSLPPRAGSGRNDSNVPSVLPWRQQCSIGAVRAGPGGADPGVSTPPHGPGQRTNVAATVSRRVGQVVSGLAWFPLWGLVCHKPERPRWPARARRDMPRPNAASKRTRR
jgi:hypothetical protein